MPTEILKVITAAGFVAVPALAAWVGLDWYFTKNGKSTRAIFIAVAGFESAVLYSYLAWTEPAPSLIFIPIGWYLGLSVVAVAIYYGLYSIYDGKADSSGSWWLLPIALVSYVALFSAVGIFCAAALARHDYLILGGHVFANSKPLPGATVILEDGNLVAIRQRTSGPHGRFVFCLKYKDYEGRGDEDKPAHLVVKATGYGEQTLELDGRPNEHLTCSFSH
jgi:hypothetical protein